MTDMMLPRRSLAGITAELNKKLRQWVHIGVGGLACQRVELLYVERVPFGWGHVRPPGMGRAQLVGHYMVDSFSSTEQLAGALITYIDEHLDAMAPEGVERFMVYAFFGKDMPSARHVLNVWPPERPKSRRTSSVSSTPARRIEMECHHCGAPFGGGEASCRYCGTARAS